MVTWIADKKIGVCGAILDIYGLLDSVNRLFSCYSGDQTKSPVTVPTVVGNKKIGIPHY